MDEEIVVRLKALISRRMIKYTDITTKNKQFSVKNDQ